MPKHVEIMSNDALHRVAILVYNGLCTFEYGIVCEVLGLYREELGGYLYDVMSVEMEDRPLKAAGGMSFTANGNLTNLEDADTIVIPGWRDKDDVVPKTICDAIRTAHKRGARLVSICSGSYVLAAAGVLNNRSATTHWQYVDDFRSKYPDVHIQANKLYVDEDDIITSAGSSAGIDACLHIVRKDFGAEVANSVARRLVIHAYRQGDQAQFIEQPLPKKPDNHQLSSLMETVRNQLEKHHTISTMAEIASMSPRTLQRRFMAFTGSPIMQWLTHERLSHACLLLESTEQSMDYVSHTAGFKTPEVMRYHFRKTFSISPMDYRKSFKRPPLNLKPQ